MRYSSPKPGRQFHWHDKARQISEHPDTRRTPAPRSAHPAGPYLPGIDGLRAVAVLAVVLYHFGLPLPGGFVGVDVFFVISGFLIGGLLWRERRTTGRIALGAFWLRRVRRLAPAYFAMAAVSALAAWFILLPFEFREFGKSLIAATLWLSNVQFWREAGYFDIGSDSKVLLHTWSLSVEEQFYVVLPLFVAAVGFWRRGLTGLLVVCWGASLVACIALTPSDPVATFFLFPFRAWELLTGVLLAIWLQSGTRIVPAWVPDLGLGLILAAVFLVSAAGFPGWQAAVPVAGAAMMLAGQNSGAGSVVVLSHRVPVFIGLISYSLYLWHWPVRVLSGYLRGGEPAWWEAALWLALAVVLAILGWALVERPLRRARIAPRRFVGGTALAGAAMLAMGAVVFVRDGMPGRFSPMVQGHIAASQDFLQDWSRCSVAADGPLAGIETCAIGPDGPPRVLIWGDSHLRALMDGLGAAALDAGTPGIIVWHAGCPPLFGLRKTESAATRAQDAACYDATQILRQGAGRIDSLERVLLVARWSYYAKGTGIGTDADNRIDIRADDTGGYVADTRAGLYAEALRATVAELTAAVGPVTVLRQIPEVPGYASRDIARALAHGRLTEATVGPYLSVVPEVLAARVMDAEAPQFALVGEGAITLIDPWPIVCQDRCSVMRAGRPLYFDNNHLTNAGAAALRPLFMPFLTGTAP